MTPDMMVVVPLTAYILIAIIFESILSLYNYLNTDIIISKLLQDVADVDILSC